MSVNVQAVTDFKIAIGAVERAACQRLRKLATEVPADQAIVEIGSHLGRTAGFLGLGSTEGNGAPVTAIDPWEDRPLDSWPEGYFDERVIAGYSEDGVQARFQAHIDECGLSDVVTAKQGYADKVARYWRKPVGLLWHDAEHTADALEADLKAWAKKVVPGGWVLAHDAGNAHFGVIEGARAALPADEWDWESFDAGTNGCGLFRWKKKPHLRGHMAIRKR